MIIVLLQYYDDKFRLPIFLDFFIFQQANDII